MKPLIKQHSLVAYFVLAFAISWLIWIPGGAAALGLLDFQLSGSLLTAIGTVGPALAAFIVTGVTGGADGPKELIGRTFQLRVGIRWILIAVLGPIVFIVLGAVILRLTGNAWSDFGQRSVFPDLGVGAVWFIFLLMAIGEEPGWRGFALPRLQARRSALSSTLILTVVWWLWHLPVFLFYPVGVDAVRQFGVFGLIPFFVTLLVQAIMYAWVYNKSRGSILVAALLHAGFNAGSSGSGSEIAPIFLGLFFVTAIIVAIATRGRLGLSAKED
jgi:membrane protease YdiL (CAAX protease family)